MFTGFVELVLAPLIVGILLKLFEFWLKKHN